jgi:hypothetical protein
MSRSIRAVLVAIVLVAAASPAFAEFTGATEVPFSTVFYCSCNKEDIVVEGTVLSAWDWSNEGATLWRVSFAGLKGIGALSGRSYDVIGDVVERFVPALGGTNAVVQASPQLLVCRAGTTNPGTCLLWNVTITLTGAGSPTGSERIAGCCRKT